MIVRLPRGKAGDMSRNLALRDYADHAARSKLGASTPASRASVSNASRLQRGMEPDDFQLDTVVGDRPRAVATFTVPPSSSMKDAMFVMRHELRKS